MVTLIGSCGFGATCGWLCAMKAGMVDARHWKYLLAAVGSIIVVAGLVYLMQGSGRVIAFACCACAFWLIHAEWQREVVRHRRFFFRSH